MEAELLLALDVGVEELVEVEESEEVDESLVELDVFEDELARLSLR